MKQEFIGLNVEIIGSAHPGYRDLRGIVVDETKNTLTVEIDGKEKMIPKPGNEFQFTFQGKKIAIKGDDIRHRPEDRIKKCR
jgi:ribonuclease P protein subunit POP4